MRKLIFNYQFYAISFVEWLNKCKVSTLLYLFFCLLYYDCPFEYKYRKTPCPVPPLNDNNFVKLMRGTEQGVKILLTIFTKKLVKIFMLLR